MTGGLPLYVADAATELLLSTTDLGGSTIIYQSTADTAKVSQVGTLGNFIPGGNIALPAAKGVYFNDSNGGTPYLVDQGDGNLVLYSTDANGNSRTIWSIQGHSSTAGLQIPVNVNLQNSMNVGGNNPGFLQLYGNSTVTGPTISSGGSGAVPLNLNGVNGGLTNLGSSGTSGSPVVSQGALIDGSGVRVALTTSGYTVPANTSLVRFTQGGTVASATVTLPTAVYDGQPVEFDNYAGAVTALTLSPAVPGWTNGSQLSANIGVRVRWDAVAGSWQRVQ